MPPTWLHWIYLGWILARWSNLSQFFHCCYLLRLAYNFWLLGFFLLMSKCPSPCPFQWPHTHCGAITRMCRQLVSCSGSWYLCNKFFQLLKLFVSVWNLHCWLFPHGALRCGPVWLSANPDVVHQSKDFFSCDAIWGGHVRESFKLGVYSWTSCRVVLLYSLCRIVFLVYSIAALQLPTQSCLPMDSLCLGVAALDHLSSVVVSDGNPGIVNTARIAAWGRNVCQKLCHGCANIYPFFLQGAGLYLANMTCVGNLCDFLPTLLKVFPYRQQKTALFLHLIHLSRLVGILMNGKYIQYVSSFLTPWFPEW